MAGDIADIIQSGLPRGEARALEGRNYPGIFSIVSP
jgi:hypothetical protein